MNIDHITSRLDGVRPDASGAMALCPAHEDSSPSLRITNIGDRILMHCHAGCYTEDVLTSIGLSWSDLYEEPIRARLAGGRLTVRDRRRIAGENDVDLTMLEWHHDGHTVAEDEPEVEAARQRMARLADRIGIDEFEQVVSHHRDRDMTVRMKR